MYFFINGHQSTLSDRMTDDLVRSVFISLFSWRRANPDDKLPGISRYGWWADTFSNDKTGSRLWLLSRAKMTQETLNRAEDYARESLEWMIEDGVASRMIVKADRGGVDQLNLSVTIVKPSREEMTLRFVDVWSDKR